MSQSPEELALFESLPPRMLERHILQIIGRLDDDFVKRNHKELSKKLDDKVGGYTVRIDHLVAKKDTICRDYITNRILISKYLEYEDVSWIFLKLIDLSNHRLHISDWLDLAMISKYPQCTEIFNYMDRENIRFVSKSDQLFVGVSDALMVMDAEGNLINSICERISDDNFLNITCKDDSERIRFSISRTSECFSFDVEQNHPVLAPCIVINITDKDFIFRFLDAF